MLASIVRRLSLCVFIFSNYITCLFHYSYKEKEKTREIMEQPKRTWVSTHSSKQVHSSTTGYFSSLIGKL